MNIIRYYNQNKKSLWTIATIIIVIIVVIQMANFMVNLRLKQESENNEIEIQYQNNNNSINNPDISVEIKEEEVKEDTALIIDQFIRYCNAGKVQEAYNLLSTSCKNNIYQSLEKFINNYYSKVYNGTKLYSKEMYADKTYKIKLFDDALTTGKVSGTYIEDYFTIVNENNEPKLNISRFIREADTNYTKESKNLNITVKKKIIYKECVEYILEVKNLTNKDIMLDSLREPKSAYLTSGNLKYYSALSENTENDLTIYANLTKTIRVKFNIEYNAKNAVSSMVFTDIILDKKQYDLADKKKDFNQVERLSIDIN